MSALKFQLGDALNQTKMNQESIETFLKNLPLQEMSSFDLRISKKNENELSIDLQVSDKTPLKKVKTGTHISGGLYDLFW